jgi:hypothetical protein
MVGKQRPRFLQAANLRVDTLHNCVEVHGASVEPNWCSERLGKVDYKEMAERVGFEPTYLQAM